MSISSCLSVTTYHAEPICPDDGTALGRFSLTDILMGVWHPSRPAINRCERGHHKPSFYHEQRQRWDRGLDDGGITVDLKSVHQGIFFPVSWSICSLLNCVSNCRYSRSVYSCRQIRKALEDLEIVSCVFLTMADLPWLPSIALNCTSDFLIHFRTQTKFLRVYIGSVYLIPGSAARLTRICLSEECCWCMPTARLWGLKAQEFWRSMAARALDELLAQGTWFKA